MHACCISLVTYGGFGFHTTEIYQRFGPETATFFFKVRSKTSLFRVQSFKFLSIIGNNVLFDTMECHRVFQQTFDFIHVCYTHTDFIYVAMGPHSRRSGCNVEHRQHTRCFLDLPTVREKLELHITGDLRKSTVFLLLNGDRQSHHRCCDYRIAHAISVQITNSLAQEASRYGFTQHWSRVSTHDRGFHYFLVDLGMLTSQVEPGPSPYIDKHCYPI